MVAGLKIKEALASLIKSHDGSYDVTVNYSKYEYPGFKEI